MSLAATHETSLNTGRAAKPRGAEPRFDRAGDDRTGAGVQRPHRRDWGREIHARRRPRARLGRAGESGRRPNRRARGDGRGFVRSRAWVASRSEARSGGHRGGRWSARRPPRASERGPKPRVLERAHGDRDATRRARARSLRHRIATRVRLADGSIDAPRVPRRVRQAHERAHRARSGGRCGAARDRRARSRVRSGEEPRRARGFLAVPASRKSTKWIRSRTKRPSSRTSAVD